MSRRFVPVLGLVALIASAAVVATAAARPATPDPRLLDRYEPVVQFDPLEQFMPTRVESFVRDSDLEQLTAAGTWAVADPQPRPHDLPGPGTGTWRLNEQACTPAAPIGGLDCYAAAAAASPARGGDTVYGRVVRENGEIVLQYWFFYYDDVYSYAYPPSDLFWQAHEGDWENVEVVLGGDEQPLLVGLSQHCTGQQRAWADTPTFGGTHPLVHVALGSHANYFTAGTHPIAVACIPPQAVAVLQAQHLPLPVDYAFAGPIAGPPGSGGEALHVRRLDGHGPGWVQFPGFWGEQQYFHAPPPIGTVASGNSPVGPAYQAVWSDPLATIATWPAG
jgi:hypothetical protein